MNRLNVYRTHQNIELPKFSTSQSACFDLAFSSEGKSMYKGYNANNAEFERAFSSGAIHIMPHERIMIPTGLIFDIPDGYSVRIHSRSGLSLKKGLVLVNAEGVIDSDYIDEVFLLMVNLSDNKYFINNRDRIAQGELVKKEEYVLWETTTKPFPKTERIGGMGSTGVGAETEVVKIKVPKIKNDALLNKA